MRVLPHFAMNTTLGTCYICHCDRYFENHTVLEMTYDEFISKLGREIRSHMQSDESEYFKSVEENRAAELKARYDAVAADEKNHLAYSKYSGVAWQCLCLVFKQDHDVEYLGGSGNSDYLGDLLGPYKGDQ